MGFRGDRVGNWGMLGDNVESLGDREGILGSRKGEDREGMVGDKRKGFGEKGEEFGDRPDKLVDKDRLGFRGDVLGGISGLLLDLFGKFVGKDWLGASGLQNYYN